MTNILAMIAMLILTICSSVLGITLLLMWKGEDNDNTK